MLDSVGYGSHTSGRKKRWNPHSDENWLTQIGQYVESRRRVRSATHAVALYSAVAMTHLNNAFVRRFRDD
jgi:hypothetical protein